MLQSRIEDCRERNNRIKDQDTRYLRDCGIDPAERLARWDDWLANELGRTLQWPQDETRRTRLMGRCAMEITGMVRQLRGRGWLLDGAALAEHVRACLAPVSAAQQAGKVRDLYPYFTRAVRDYVGQNAEVIQQHARRINADESVQSVGAILSNLLGNRLTERPPSLTELIVARAQEVRAARTLREALAARRKAAKAQQSAKLPHLPGF